MSLRVYEKDDPVNIKWKGGWLTGKIKRVLAYANGLSSYLVSYDGWKSRYDEVLTPKEQNERLRGIGETGNESIPFPTPVSYKVDDPVVCIWRDGKEYPGRIGEVRRDAYRVHFFGWKCHHDKWYGAREARLLLRRPIDDGGVDEIEKLKSVRKVKKGMKTQNKKNVENRDSTAASESADDDDTPTTDNDKEDDGLVLHYNRVQEQQFQRRFQAAIAASLASSSGAPSTSDSATSRPSITTDEQEEHILSTVQPSTGSADNGKEKQNELSQLDKLVAEDTRRKRKFRPLAFDELHMMNGSAVIDPPSSGASSSLGHHSTLLPSLHSSPWRLSLVDTPVTHTRTVPDSPVDSAMSDDDSLELTVPRTGGLARSLSSSSIWDERKVSQTGPVLSSKKSVLGATYSTSSDGNHIMSDDEDLKSVGQPDSENELQERSRERVSPSDVAREKRLRSRSGYDMEEENALLRRQLAEMNEKMNAMENQILKLSTGRQSERSEHFDLVKFSFIMIDKATRKKSSMPDSSETRESSSDDESAEEQTVEAAVTESLVILQAEQNDDVIIFDDEEDSHNSRYEDKEMDTSDAIAVAVTGVADRGENEKEPISDLREEVNAKTLAQSSQHLRNLPDSNLKNMLTHLTNDADEGAIPEGKMRARLLTKAPSALFTQLKSRRNRNEDQESDDGEKENREDSAREDVQFGAREECADNENGILRERVGLKKNRKRTHIIKGRGFLEGVTAIHQGIPTGEPRPKRIKDCDKENEVECVAKKVRKITQKPKTKQPRETRRQQIEKGRWSLDENMWEGVTVVMEELIDGAIDQTAEILIDRKNYTSDWEFEVAVAELGHERASSYKPIMCNKWKCQMPVRKGEKLENDGDCEYKREQRIECPEDCINKNCTNRRSTLPHPIIQVRRYLHFGGKGVAAGEFISRGTLIWEFCGEVREYADYCEHLEKQKRLCAEYGRYAIAVNGSGDKILVGYPEYVINPESMGNVALLMNHKCQPNVRLETWLVNGRIRTFAVAIVDIHYGVQLCWHYGGCFLVGEDPTGETMERKECCCGSMFNGKDVCEKVVGGTGPFQDLRKTQEEKNQEKREEIEKANRQKEAADKQKKDLQEERGKRRENRGKPRIN